MLTEGSGARGDTKQKRCFQTVSIRLTSLYEYFIHIVKKTLGRGYQLDAENRQSP